MTERALPGAAVAVLLLAALFPVTSAADGYLPQRWWPSEWGADDQRGAMNRLTPDKVLAAAKLIERGVVYDMGRVFEEDMPLFTLTPEDRKYTLTVPGGPSWGPLGENRLAWNEDYISGHLSQDGTQMDSLAHMATVLGKPGDQNAVHYYNGFTQHEIGGGRGLSKLGAEHMVPVFTRGILVDVAAYKGRMLERGEEISLADLLGALKAAGLTENDVQPGDAFFYNTGWGSLWKTDNEKFNSGTPGLSIEAGDWLVKKKVVLVGTDNWAVEAIPHPDPKWFAPNHQKFLVQNGIYIIENLDFSRLLEAGVHRFAFVVAPLPLKGATGSPVRPFAIH
jgi:kynurenine formamidase